MLKRLVAIGIAAVVIALDQLSKTWIMQHFQPGGAQRVTDFFDLVYARNTGAAFSLYADQPGWQRAFFITIALFASAVILLLLQRKSLSLMARIGLGLVLGGALASGEGDAGVLKTAGVVQGKGRVAGDGDGAGEAAEGR
jgi:signal peptidase II